MRENIIAVFCCAVLFAGISSGADKKIIYSGWDSPDTQWVRDNWRQMERCPLDGTTILIAVDRAGEKSGNWHLGAWVTSSKELRFEDYQEAVNDLKDVRWKNFTDNFLAVPMSHSLTAGMHWFDDARWNVFLKNLEVFTKIGREIRTKGLIIDVEDYGYELFSYEFMNSRCHKADFREYQEKAYERGRQAMKAINTVRPDITLLFYFAWSLPVNDLMTGVPREKQRYALLPAFLDGMLSAATPGTTFHEGFEYAYGYRKKEDFERARKLIMEEGRKLTQSPEKFDRQVGMGFGLWLDNNSVWHPEKPLRNYFSSDEWGDTLNDAVTVCDRYVWIYSQEAKFFASPNISQSYLDVMKDVRAGKWSGRRNAQSGKAIYSGFAALELTTKKYTTDNPAENEENTFGDFWKQYEFVNNLPSVWKFRTDPQNVGVKEKWFDGSLKESRDMEVGKWWEEQGLEYDGYAWYQTEFSVPATLKGRKVFLAFGAVDETAEIYVNGRLAGEHKVDPNIGWNQKFLVDAAPYLKYGKNNTVTVRVYDGSKYGGIWKAVKLVAEK